MKFGIGPYAMQAPPGSSETHEQLYRELLTEAETAEKLGFESIWLAEHHFLDDGCCPSLLPTAAAVAARTERIKIGTSCFLFPLFDPIHVAEDSAVVDIISRGRLILGVAAAYRSEEFEGFCIERNHRGKRLDEGLEVLINAWTREKFSFRGEVFRYEDLMVTPKPVQKPHPPIWVGTSGEPGIRRTARLGYPLVASPRHHPNELKAHYALYRKYLKEYGKPLPGVPIIRELYVAETQEKAEADAKEHVLYVQTKQYAKWTNDRPFTDDKGRPVSAEREVGWDDLKGRFIIGNSNHVVKEIEKYKEELGMDYLIARLRFTGMPVEKSFKAMELFTKEVMPQFT